MSIFQLWITGLILSLQYIIPLIQAIQLLRVKDLNEKKEGVTKIIVYFMIQAFVILLEQTFYLYLIPGFRIVKALTMIYLRFPQTEGALYLYFAHIEKYYQEFEKEMDKRKGREILNMIPGPIKAFF